MKSRVLCLCALCLAPWAGSRAMTVRSVAPRNAADVDYYPVAGGVSGRAGAEPTLPQSSNSMRIEYRLAEAEIGAALTSERPVWHIGDFLTGDAIPADVDWTATKKACDVSPVAGRIRFLESSTDVSRRVLLVGGGNVTIPWHLKGGAVQTNGYYVGKTISERPCRLFWTDGTPKSGDQPYNGPPINLDGHYVEIFGDPDVLKIEYGAPSVVGGESNVVRGVYVEPGSATLHAKAEMGEGPKGQFVLAYYDTADRRNLIGVTVVEVMAPDPQTVRVHVGDRLLPTGGGYGIDGLTPIVKRGATQTFGTGGSDGSPWIELFCALRPFSEKANALYAISPTDNTTGTYDHPSDADVYWEAPDAMKTLWPFEETYYLISWNKDDVRMVTATGDAATSTLFVPTNYTASISAFMVNDDDAPTNNIASIDNDNQVSVNMPGRFLLKLNFDDDVRYLPIHAVDRTDPSVGTAGDESRTFDATADIGATLRPLGGAYFANSTRTNLQTYAALFSSSRDGFIYEAKSAPIWNPHLYHAPQQSRIDIASPDDLEADPLTQLKSAICLVQKSNADEEENNAVEVWWSRDVTVTGGGETLPFPISVPGFVNRYAAGWPECCHEIVLTSQRGSSVPTPAPSARAFQFGTTNDVLYATDDMLSGGKTVFGSGEPVSFGLWLNLKPAGGDGHEFVPGRLASVQFDNSTEIAFEIADKKGALSVSVGAPGGAATVTPLGTVASGGWTNVAVTVADDRKVVAFLGEEAFDCAVRLPAGEGGDTRLTRIALGGAAGWAADEITVWGVHLGGLLHGIRSRDGKGGEKALAEAELFRFDAGAMMGEAELSDAADDYRYALEVRSRGVLKAEGAPTWLEPGAPVVSSGDVAESDGVSPRIYRQTDGTLPGHRFNYEHAFIANGSVWALRNDQSENDEAYVLVECAEDGYGAMRTFRVIDDTDLFPAQSYATVGDQLPPPYPLRLLEGYWNEHNSHELDRFSRDCVWHRDRKLNDWARRDGPDRVIYWYLPREDFDALSDNLQRKNDGYVKWRNYDDADLNWWTWNAKWPDSAPVLYVGQTLTKPVNGLPEVWNMASCDVLYPAVKDYKYEDYAETKPTNNVVRLVDPVTAKTAKLPIKSQFTAEYGFEVGPSGTTTLRQGKYYFPDLPPSIADRFYVDTNAEESKRMVLVGDLQEPAAGNPYLRWNLLSAQEADELRRICPEGAEHKQDWDDAVNNLATNGLDSVVTHKDEPVANYALFADGHESGWVTLIENDSTNTHMVAEGDPIDVKVIFVTNALYAGTCMTVQNKLNKLSEMLTVQYNDAYPGMSNDFDLVWYRYGDGTPADGNVPSTSRIPNDGLWVPYAGGKDQTSFVLGKTGTTLSELVNTYYCLRYVPKPGTPAAATCGTQAGVTTDPALAEGWVQRVLNALTPFAQRVEDFYSNPSDIWYTMFEQIGKPYRGDVALNNDNLTEIGLLELYRTVFNKAWKLSFGSPGYFPDTGVDKQLMLAASRIADLYQLLGAEAYADAKNPLISQGFNDTYLGELQNLPSSTFCFQNQVRTLLDEELALLRGRELGDAPNMTTQPCYNRLYWNFTKGITEGEVAYVNNYGIRADQGVLTIDQAAKQYPQGHGDAWGHYLSSIQLYYTLLANPTFDWHATKMEMNLSAAVANEDYYDEQKFADSAVKLAQIGLDATDLTARKSWRDLGGDVRGGYADANATQAFGYGEWAVRTMLGGLCNWVTINAIVPPVQSEQSNTETGLNKIDRSTVPQLGELCTLVDRVQQKVNALDAGLNPLGLSQNAVPMDIDPDELAAKNSHFDQILERAERALANCEAVLDFANQYGARLQQIQNAETTAGTEQENAEATYNRDLITIYGTPYPGDIGTGCLYPQGYEGPDLYHYMYMDLEEFGMPTNELEVAFTKELVLYKVNSAYDGHDGKMPTDDTATIKVSYSVTSGGIVVKPDNFGVRLKEGRIQAAYRTYLEAYVKAMRASKTYDSKVKTMKEWAKKYYQYYAMRDTLLFTKQLAADVSYGLDLAISGLDKTAAALQEADTNLNYQVGSVSGNLPKIIIGGTSVSQDPQAIYRASVSGPILSSWLASQLAGEAVGNAKKAKKVVDGINTFGLDTLQLALDMLQNDRETQDKYWTLVTDVKNAAYDAQDAIGALSTAEAAYRAVVAEGEALQAERERIRKQQSNNATQYRYADMYNRVQRNNALTKYSTAFDVAQRYVWELAKVYDYETGLLSSDPQAGDKFLAEIVGSRQLGYPGVSTSQATDKGLYDIVNRMKENWAVLKGRLGVNNPANTATEFSLRYELFRIKPDETGDGAWQEELKKYWVDDLKADPDYRRYCQPLVSTAGPVAKEPGLVIPFSTVINNAENFFGKTLQGGDHAYSSADYATKVHAVGVAFDGYDALTVQTAAGLAADPNVYLVPVGHDYMRAPSGDLEPAVLAWNVVDQVLPLPYAVGSTELDDTDWIATFSGLDGTRDSTAKIRRHSTFRANGETYATRLVGRSVWNDRWILVIPASSLNANREAGLTTFINGVKDIKLKIRAYSRSGN